MNQPGALKLAPDSAHRRGSQRSRGAVAAALMTLLVACTTTGGVAASAGEAVPAAGTSTSAGTTQTGDYLYRTVMLRAAPGSLARVIEMIRERIPVWSGAADAGPFWMRHSQGDQWDLLLLFPAGPDFAAYYGSEAANRRARAAAASGESEAQFLARLRPHVSWQEELWVYGPGPQAVASRFAGADFYHVEIFLALAGKRDELVTQRQMENVYLDGIGRAPNLIFRRAGGAAWDCYTIGFYRDIKHYAESADIPADVEDRAAVMAGFESSSTIGTYLRELIAAHHDTLAVAVR